MQITFSLSNGAISRHPSTCESGIESGIECTTFSLLILSSGTKRCWVLTFPFLLYEALYLKTVLLVFSFFVCFFRTQALYLITVMQVFPFFVTICSLRSTTLYPMITLFGSCSFFFFFRPDTLFASVHFAPQSLLPNPDMSWTSDIEPLLQYYTERTPGAVMEVCTVIKPASISYSLLVQSGGTDLCYKRTHVYFEN